MTVYVLMPRNINAERQGMSLQNVGVLKIARHLRLKNVKKNQNDRMKKSAMMGSNQNCTNPVIACSAFAMHIFSSALGNPDPVSVNREARQGLATVLSLRPGGFEGKGIHANGLGLAAVLRCEF